MLEDTDRERIHDVLAGQPARLGLVLRNNMGDAALATLLSELARDVASASEGAVTVAEDTAEGLPAAPGLTLTSGSRRNIHYLALPEGLEVAPFVDLVLTMAGETPKESEEAWASSLATLEEPAELLVFISAACPHCAHTVRAAHQVALASPKVTVLIVDAQRFEDLAETYHVRSVPLTVIDGELSITGAVSSAELTERILGRNTPEHSTRILVSLLETGRTSDATQRILEEGDATAFAQAWRRSVMSLRMGLMLVAEEALESDAHALDGVVGDLLASLDAEDAGLRGDTADLLAQIGHPAALPALGDHVSDPNPDVAEAVAEAIARIRRGEDA